jgi:hypothetical protein
VNKTDLQSKKTRLQYELSKLPLDLQLARHKHQAAFQNSRVLETELADLKNWTELRTAEIQQEIDSIDQAIEHGHQQSIVQETTQQHTTSELPEEMLWPMKLQIDQTPNNFSANCKNEVTSQFNKSTGVSQVIDRVNAESIKYNDIELRGFKDINEYMVLMVGYYHDTTVSLRKDCTIQALKSNLESKNFDKIVMFTYCDDNKIDVEHELFKDHPDMRKNIMVVQQKQLLTYYQMLLFCNTEIQISSDNVCVVLAESTTIFPENLHLLKKINLNGKVFCLSEQSKDQYHQIDAWIVDNTIPTHKISDQTIFGDRVGGEMFTQQLFQSGISIYNVSVTGHMNVTKTDTSGYTYKDVKNTPASGTIWPYAKTINHDNYVVGDICAMNSCNYFYEDRFSGIPGNYFVRDLKTHFYTYTDKLCVFYMTCMKEIKNGSLYECIKRFFTKTVSTSKCFDLYICMDIDCDEQLIINNIRSILKTCKCSAVHDICVISASLTPEQNIFTYDLGYYETIPPQPLGASNGINQTFYHGMSEMQQARESTYKYMLMLESDCIPVTDCWYDYLHDHCDKNPDGVIIGSKHKGLEDGHRVSYYADHINGVAVYRNSAELTKLMNGSKHYLEEWLKTSDKKLMNFDVATYLYAKKARLTKGLVDVDYISNYSSVENTHLTVNQVLERHPETVILHKKIPNL